MSVEVLGLILEISQLLESLDCDSVIRGKCIPLESVQPPENCEKDTHVLVSSLRL